MLGDTVEGVLDVLGPLLRVALELGPLQVGLGLEQGLLLALVEHLLFDLDLEVLLALVDLDELGQSRRPGRLVRRLLLLFLLFFLLGLGRVLFLGRLVLGEERPNEGGGGQEGGPLE